MALEVLSRRVLFQSRLPSPPSWLRLRLGATAVQAGIWHWLPYMKAPLKLVLLPCTSRSAMSAVFQLLFVDGANMWKRVDGVKLAVDAACYVFPLGSPGLPTSVKNLLWSRLPSASRTCDDKSFQYLVLTSNLMWPVVRASLLFWNSDYFHSQHQPTDLCNGDVLCFLWGADWILK
jgi:hypothetical protein